jgi:hypothetical protein
MILEKLSQSAVIQSPFHPSSAVCDHLLKLAMLRQTLPQLEKMLPGSLLGGFFTATPESSRVNRLLHKKIKIRFMTLRKTGILLSLLAFLLVAASCDHSVVTGSKLTISNYDQITPGMSKAQVERILGPPTTVETKDMMIFKKTTYRYEDGKKFAMFTFKNDELDSKEGNLQREP